MKLETSKLKLVHSSSEPVAAWHYWFAWHPIRTWDHRWVWMARVSRRLMRDKADLPGIPIHYWWEYHYESGYADQ